MIYDDVVHLLAMIDRFVSGSDQSPVLAGEIEGIVLECFNDEPWFDDLSVALAQFAPGGDERYYDEAALASELKVAAKALKAGWGKPIA